MKNAKKIMLHVEMCMSAAIGLLSELDRMRAQLRMSTPNDEARMIVYPNGLNKLCEAMERCYLELHCQENEGAKR